ncbi:MAG: hypothetical protein WEB06_18445 [Actinomycetota bacterium]
MKRREKDVAQRLLDEYLEYIESWRLETMPRPERSNVVVLDVMQYRVVQNRRTIPRTATSEPRAAILP